MGRASAPTRGLVRATRLVICASIAVCLISPFGVAAARPRSPALAARLPMGLQSLRLVDYFPAANGWSNQWTRWDAAQTDADFSRIAGLGGNAVRIIVRPDTFGYPTPSSVMTDRLARTIAMATQRGLRTELTLFDGWYDWGDVARSEQWAQALLAPYVGDDRLAYIDVHNELPADKSRSALAWAAEMIPFVQRVARVPTTASISISSGTQPLEALIDGLGSASPDLYDVHYYGNASLAYPVLASAKQLAAASPMVVGETGFSTQRSYGWAGGLDPSDASLEEYQDYYLRTVDHAARLLGLPRVGLWMLYDLKPGAMMAGAIAPAWGYAFGLVRTDGSEKPAASSVSMIFGDRDVPLGFNGDFEDASGTPGQPPHLWRAWLPNMATFALDRSTAHSGNSSMRIVGAQGDSTGCPALYAAPLTGVQTGVRYRASAWVRGRDAQGTSKVVLVWSDGQGRFVGQNESSSVPAGSSSWTLLSVSATPPEGAAAVEINLKVCSNSGATWYDDVAFSPTGPLPKDGAQSTSGAAEPAASRTAPTLTESTPAVPGPAGTPSAHSNRSPAAAVGKGASPNRKPSMSRSRQLAERQSKKPGTRRAKKPWSARSRKAKSRADRRRASQRRKA